MRKRIANRKFRFDLLIREIAGGVLVQSGGEEDAAGFAEDRVSADGVCGIVDPDLPRRGGLNRGNGHSGRFRIAVDDVADDGDVLPLFSPGGQIKLIFFPFGPDPDSRSHRDSARQKIGDIQTLRPLRFGIKGKGDGLSDLVGNRMEAQRSENIGSRGALHAEGEGTFVPGIRIQREFQLLPDLIPAEIDVFSSGGELIVPERVPEDSVPSVFRASVSEVVDGGIEGLLPDGKLFNGHAADGDLCRFAQGDADPDFFQVVGENLIEREGLPLAVQREGF